MGVGITLIWAVLGALLLAGGALYVGFLFPDEEKEERDLWDAAHAGDSLAIELLRERGKIP